ncbi:MAG: ATP-binding protein [Terracidiphilus sp.]|jgi:hypothetical protein
MLTNAERFYKQLSSLRALTALVGKPEDADFDCKVWPARPDDARRVVAKAACGFANATGGVIVIGVKASGAGADTPDVVRALAPVGDRHAVASAALEIVLQSVEPGIEGIRTKTIPDGKSRPSGFVLLFVPASEGPPRRSKIDGRFYLRVASGTLPMEFFQIEERFGRRPLPKLGLVMDVSNMMMDPPGHEGGAIRRLVFGLKNDGRGMAKFPGIRFKRSRAVRLDNYGIDGNTGFGLPPRPSEPEWIVFRGGVDDVIYPGETRLIGKLIQTAVHKGDRGIPPKPAPGQFAAGFRQAERHFVCEALDLEYEISAEGTVTQKSAYKLAEDELPLVVAVR